MTKQKFYSMKQSADGQSGDIFIYNEIFSEKLFDEEVSASSFKEDLDALGDVSNINLYINSPGGDVFSGVAIYNQLKRHKARVNVHVDALAASIASVIAMAGDSITIPSNSMMMIHNPFVLTMGNAEELRKQADDLDRIGQSVNQAYLDKAGDALNENDLQAMLDAETWLNAQECCDLGLADAVDDATEMVASVNDDLFRKYHNVPKNLSEKDNTISSEEMAKRQEIAEKSKANSAYLDNILGGFMNGNTL